MELDQWIISSEEPPPEEIIEIHTMPEEDNGFHLTPVAIIAIVALAILILVIIIAIAH